MYTTVIEFNCIKKYHNTLILLLWGFVLVLDFFLFFFREGELSGLLSAVIQSKQKFHRLKSHHETDDSGHVSVKQH